MLVSGDIIRLVVKRKLILVSQMRITNNSNCCSLMMFSALHGEEHRSPPIAEVSTCQILGYPDTRCRNVQKCEKVTA